MTTAKLTGGPNLPQLVREYFESYAQGTAPLARVEDLPGLGAIRVEVFGDLADRLRNVSIPNVGTGGGRVLQLLLAPALDPDRLQGFDLPAPGSPLLRCIREDLAGRAGYARSVAVVPAWSAGTDLLALFERSGVRIPGLSPTAEVRYDWNAYYLVTFHLRLTGRTPADEVVRVALDAGGQPLPSAAAVRFAELDMQMVDARQAVGEYATAAAVPPATRAEAEEVIRLSRQIAEAQAQSFVRGRVEAAVGERERDRTRITAFYEHEIQNTVRPTDRRAKAQERDRELTNLDTRFAVEAKLALAGFQEVLLPVVRYQIAAAGRRIRHDFWYDVLTRSLHAAPCPRCAAAKPNGWAVCAAGRHLECDACGTIRPCSHPGCPAAGCADHVRRCADPGCAADVCEDHARGCAHCTRPERYCPAHVAADDDGKPICSHCRGVCDTCGGFFPLAVLVACAATGQLVCPKDRVVCDGCGNFVAPTGAAVVEGRDGRRCGNCRGACGSCPPDRQYATEDLAACTDCGKRLCGSPAHRKRCAATGVVLCEGCAVDTVEGPGSVAAFAACRSCDRLATPGRAKAVRRAGLRACGLCSPPDDLHCTAAGHVKACAQCRQGVCGGHAVAVVGGVGCRRAECVGRCTKCRRGFARGQLAACPKCNDVFCADDLHPCTDCGRRFCAADLHDTGGGDLRCAEHAAACPDCPPGRAWHRPKDVAACTTCQKPLCRSHQRKPAFGAGVYCEADAGHFVGCPGCGRAGPDAARVTCACCGTGYCPLCYTHPQDAACRHCHRLWGRRGEGTTAPGPVWAERLAVGGRPHLTGGGHAFVAYTPGGASRLEYLLVTPGGLLARVRKLFGGSAEVLFVWDAAARQLTARPGPAAPGGRT